MAEETKITHPESDVKDEISPEKVLALVEKKAFPALRALLCTLPAADIGELIEELPQEHHPLIYRILPKELAAEVFVEMDSDAQARLIACFSDRELREVLDELYLDDTVDLIEEMPAGVVARILKNSSADARREINELLKYPKDSAGSIMTTEFVALKRHMTVDEAFKVIRRVAIDKETIYTCYVTDENRHLLGIVTAKTLMISPVDAILENIMEKNCISVSTLTDKEEVAHLFNKYNFLAMPVVDKEDRLVGIVTVDDAIDVLQEETEEDFAMMAAITPSEDPYIKTSAFTIFTRRIPWLMVLMISATFTGMIIASFESALAACVVLTAFIPMLMGTGGNSGSQASTTVIRGLSTGEVTMHDTATVLWKEFRVALLCAISLGAVTFGKVMLVDGLLFRNSGVTPMVALVVAITLALTVVCAKLIGCSLPILAKRIGFDPAVMANPFISTIVDTVSLLLYFLMACLLLHLPLTS